MPAFFDFTGPLIDAIRINKIECVDAGGRRRWVKERRPLSPFIIGCANQFFRLVENPVVVCSPTARWQQWESGSFNLLHGAEGFRAEPHGSRAVWLDPLPGVPLQQFAIAETLTQGMLLSAGRELRRVHALACPQGGGAWSHGDPHLGNFLYDEREDRARIIDFEVYHRPGMSEHQRHTDDLLVMLQDLMGRADLASFQQRADWFLRGYGADETLFASLSERLGEPRGVARLWWAIRTGYLPAAERQRRIVALRAWCQAGPPAFYISSL